MADPRQQLDVVLKARNETKVAFDEVRQDAKKLAGEVAGEGGVGGLAGLKGAFGRGSAFTLAMKTLAGGGAVMGLNLAAGTVKALGEEFEQLAKFCVLGGASYQDIVDKIVTSVPIFGKAFQGLDSVSRGLSLLINPEMARQEKGFEESAEAAKHDTNAINTLRGALDKVAESTQRAKDKIRFQGAFGAVQAATAEKLRALAKQETSAEVMSESIIGPAREDWIAQTKSAFAEARQAIIDEERGAEAEIIAKRRAEIRKEDDDYEKEVDELKKEQRERDKKAAEEQLKDAEAIARAQSEVRQRNLQLQRRDDQAAIEQIREYWRQRIAAARTGAEREALAQSEARDIAKAAGRAAAARSAGPGGFAAAYQSSGMFGWAQWQDAALRRQAEETARMVEQQILAVSELRKMGGQLAAMANALIDGTAGWV